MSREYGDPRADQDPPVERADLLAHLRSGCKPPEDCLVGLEYEELGVDPVGRALPYYGEGGVEEVLEALAETYGLEGHREEGHLIGLEGPKGAGVSLEPGGQMEFITAPRASLEELETDVCGWLEAVVAAGGEQRSWLGLGVQPVTPLGEMEWISRERYRIMARHLGARGDLAHRMMTQTAGVQVNLDFQDDADAAAKLRTAMGVTSLVTAAYASSPVYEGKLQDWATYRAHIWTRTDPERCGLLRAAVEGDGMDLEAWIDYALDASVMFVVREGLYQALDGRSFRRYLDAGYRDFHATLADWRLHLTTLFPEVRLKTYLEVRGMDGVPRPLGLAAAALWKGLLYSAAARDAAWGLVADLDWSERLELHETASREGTRGVLRGRPLHAWCRDLVAIARDGLRDPARAAPAENEERYLEPLEERLAEGGPGSPALEIRELWEGPWNRDPARLVEHCAFAPCHA